MEKIIKKLTQLKILPVVVLDDVDKTHQLSDALITGGLPCAEVTFRTPAADKCIKTMSSRGDISVVAGTIRTVDQVKSAMDSGAKCIVTPGLNRNVIQYCVDNKILVIPGICTPSEIEIALEYNLSVLKFFPAESFGGIQTLKAMSGPYPTVRYLPTGGINKSNLLEYLSFSKVLACGGSWMVDQKLINANQFDMITRLSIEAVKAVKEIA